MAEAVPFDAADLAGYAGRVHDYVAAHPQRWRLLRWGQLEAVDDEQSDDGVYRAVVGGKVAAVRQALDDGVIDAGWEPVDVLVLVSQLATAWADQGSGDHRDAEFLAARRAAIERAVRLIFPQQSCQCSPLR